VLLALVLFPAYTAAVGLLRGALTQVLGPAWATDQVVFAVMVNLTHTAMYVSWTGMFAAFDAYGLFSKYKMARKPHMALKKGLVAKALSEQAVGQLLINPLLTYWAYPTFVSHGLLGLDASLPPAAAMFRTFIVAHVVNGVGFYAAHRLLHCSVLYATLHKQHHEFAGTVGLAAEYANPIENILSNTLPSLGGVIFFGGTHPLVFSLWLALRLQQTYEGFTKNNSFV
jgi:sterol desaturase/sphingolipid hydroxylase (fatty acid hydroxylase superfamily)